MKPICVLSYCRRETHPQMFNSFFFFFFSIESNTKQNTNFGIWGKESLKMAKEPRETLLHTEIYILHMCVLRSILDTLVVSDLSTACCVTQMQFHRNSATD